MNIACAIRTSALCLSLLLAGGQLGWGDQSTPPQKEKEQTGSQAGSSGKEGTEQLGSKGSTESPLRKCDTDTTKDKTTKKKKSKKPPSKPS